MKKINIKLVLLLFFILLLDYAALDDITTGNEPNYIGEYLFLFWSLVFFIALIQYKGDLGALYKDIKIADKQNKDLKNYIAFRTAITLILFVFLSLGLILVSIVQVLNLL